MKRLLDGSIEGTPEELAAYQRALTPPGPLPGPNPNWPGPRMCDTCQAKLARGEMAVCMCVLPDVGKFTC